MNNNMLDVVDSWLGGSGDDQQESKQPVFEKRPQRLGLGAKYVPHKKVMFESYHYLQEETTNSLLKKKLNRERRRKRERDLENKEVSSESDSDEEMQSRAKAIKSKVIQKNKVLQVKNQQKVNSKLNNRKFKK